MNGALLQSRINHGYAMAANQIGTAHTWYRAATPLTPLQPVNSLGTLPASFNIGGQYLNQPKADVWLWQALADGSQLQIGDYLVGAETWCIVGMQALMPIMALRCTDSISISRAGPISQTADGAQQSTVQVASGIPCYVQVKRDKGFSAPAGYQGGATNTSAPMPDWLVYVGLGGVTPAGFIKDGDIITNQVGDQWKVDAASTSTVIWQLYCTPYKPNA